MIIVSRDQLHDEVCTEPMTKVAAGKKARETHYERQGSLKSCFWRGGDIRAPHDAVRFTATSFEQRLQKQETTLILSENSRTLLVSLFTHALKDGKG